MNTIRERSLPQVTRADDLALLRQDGQIKKLILCLECDGHFIDFAEID